MMETLGMTPRMLVAAALGFTAGAGVVAYYAERTVRSLRAQLRYLQRLADNNMRAKGRI